MTNCVQSTNLSDEHLEDENPETPPVDGAGVWRLCEDLGSKELRSSTERWSSVPMTHSLLTQTEVSDLHKALHVEKQVIQLQVPSRSNDASENSDYKPEMF